MTDESEQIIKLDEVVLSYSPSDDPRVAAYSMATNLKSIFKFYTPAGDTSHCYVYQDQKGIWLPIGKEWIQEIVTRSMSQFFKTRILNEVINQIRFSTRDQSVTLGGMAPSRIVMANGVFDMDTCKFSPEFAPEDYQLVALPYEYDADCPRFKLFLVEVCPDEEAKLALVEFMGYCLVHHHRIHTFVVLVGKGENGKDRFCGALITMLGKENISGMSIQQLAHDKFMAASLLDKLANICPDIPDAPIKITGIIKALTGESFIQVQEKHHTGFTYENYAKLLFSANQIPAVNDSTDAWFRRVRIIEFPNQFLVSNPKRDENLSEKLAAEVQGIFNLAVEGWQRLKAQGKLTGTRSTEDNRIDYLKRSNPLQYFVHRFCKPDLETMITVDAAFQCYKQVSIKLGKFPITKNYFSSRLLEMMENVESRQTTIEGKNTRIYAGLNLDLELLEKELDTDKHGISTIYRGILRYLVYNSDNAVFAGTDPDQEKLMPNLQVEDILDHLRKNPGKQTDIELREHLRKAGFNVDNWAQVFGLVKTNDNVSKAGKTPICYSWIGDQSESREEKKSTFPRLKRDRAQTILKLFVSEGQTISNTDIQKQLTDIYGSEFEDKIAIAIEALVQEGVLMEKRPGVYRRVA